MGDAFVTAWTLDAGAFTVVKTAEESVIDQLWQKLQYRNNLSNVSAYVLSTLRKVAHTERQAYQRRPGVPELATELETYEANVQKVEDATAIVAARLFESALREKLKTIWQLDDRSMSQLSAVENSIVVKVAKRLSEIEQYRRIDRVSAFVMILIKEFNPPGALRNRNDPKALKTSTAASRAPYGGSSGATSKTHSTTTTTTAPIRSIGRPAGSSIGRWGAQDFIQPFQASYLK